MLGWPRRAAIDALFQPGCQVVEPQFPKDTGCLCARRKRARGDLEGQPVMAASASTRRCR
jgi:hypothetical protein